MTLPNFLVIGAGRSGTTSLHEYLSQHPQVFVCAIKSPNFFASADPQPPWEGPLLQAMARQWVSDPREYEALFDNAGAAKAVGEVSPVYLQGRRIPQRIRQMCPDANIVAILRQPVDRAYAQFMGRRRDGLESRDDFAEVVQQELSQPLPDDVAFGCYLGCGRYHHFLKPYFDLFPREQIRVYLFDDLLADPAALVADLFAFLDVDSTFVPDLTRRYGRTGEAANPIGRFIWTRSAAMRTALRPLLPRAVRDLGARIFLRNLLRPSLDPDLRRRLVDLFRDDITQLQQLINRDLSHWLQPPAI